MIWFDLICFLGGVCLDLGFFVVDFLVGFFLLLVFLIDCCQILPPTDRFPTDCWGFFCFVTACGFGGFLRGVILGLLGIFFGSLEVFS